MLNMIFNAKQLFLFIERTIVESGETSSGTGTSPLNTMLIVGLALVISLLAKSFADRGRRK